MPSTMPMCHIEPAVLAGRMTGVRSSAIRDLLAVTQRPDVISLAGGLPAADGFPVSELRRIIDRRLRSRPLELLQYGPTEGHLALRQWIALDEGRRHDRPLPVDRVLVTSGAQQAIDLIGRVLVDRDVTVVVEQPTYLGAVHAFSLYEPRMATVPVDADGLQVDVLADLLAAGLRPRLVYAVSTFQNPSGATLSPERRRELARLADHYGFWIVDDDPYHELRFEGAAPPVIGTFTDRVIRLGSFSKTVAPGLRVGWAVAPTELVDPLVRVKQAADLQASSFAQPVLVDLVSDDRRYQAHLARLRTIYSQRADALVVALASTFGDRLDLSRPQGGMFVWARFTDGTDTRELLDSALEAGVAFVPGAEFWVGDGGQPWMRLSYATNPPEALATAVARLATAVADHRPKSSNRAYAATA